MNFNATKPLFSIVTICFNAEFLIELTIKSVLEQTYKNIEYIIIDGSSTDGTINIIKKYTDRITTWISEPDKGIFDAMNKGIDHCKGEYVAFMNAGDYYELDACEKMAEHIRQHQDIGVLYGNTNLIISTLNSKYKYSIFPAPLIDDKILVSPLFCHQSSFVKRTLFNEYGYFDNVKIAGDWLHFVLLYNNKINFLYINVTIANYLEGGASTTVSGFKESFPYKKKFGTFRKKDYITLLFFYIKDNAVFRNIVNPIFWNLKYFLSPSRYKKIDQ